MNVFYRVNIESKFHHITNTDSRDHTLVLFWTHLYPKVVLLTVHFEIFFDECFFDVNTSTGKLKSEFIISLTRLSDFKVFLVYFLLFDLLSITVPFYGPFNIETSTYD